MTSNANGNNVKPFTLFQPKKLFILLLFASLAVLLSIVDRAPLHLDHDPQQSEVRLKTTFMIYYEGVLYQTYPGPYSYRFLVPYLINATNMVLPFLHPIAIDFTFKIILIFIIQWCFFSYLKNFFSPIEALAGVLIKDVLLAFCLSPVHGPTVIETTDLFNLAIFSAAFIALYKQKFGYLCLLIFIGTLNRETPLFFIPIVFLLYGMKGRNLNHLLAVSTASILPYILLRLLIHPPVPDWFTAEGIDRNIPFLTDKYTMKAIMANIHFIMLLGPLLLFSLYKFSEHPRYLKVISYITPLFIVVHYILGNLIESRLWMPLLLVLIPLVLNTMKNVLQGDKNFIAQEP